VDRRQNIDQWKGFQKMITCIDLKECFGNCYRVVAEESYRAERGDTARIHDPWLLVIPCKYGHIYPHGGECLAASTTHRGPLANQLAALSCVRVVQDGDDGVNAVFHIDDFDQVAAVMKPKRRRKLSSDHAKKLAAAGVAALARHRNSNDAGKARRRDAKPAPGPKVA
jgi:hypothetical protein